MSRYDFSAGDEVTAAKLNKNIRAGSYNAGETINGATLPVACYQNTTDNEFYACDANDTAKMKFIGFAISNGTDGNSIDIQFNGIVNGFTGLSEGEKYYVQDDKTIGTTPGTYNILVGEAISETELVIMKDTTGVRAGNTSGTSTTEDTTITVGFRPKAVLLWGAHAKYDTSAAYTASGFAIDQSTVGTGGNYHTSSSVDDHYSAIYTNVALNIKLKTENVTITITFSSTGFVINWGGTSTLNIDITWLALK
jgi:hypothetical protein